MKHGLFDRTSRLAVSIMFNVVFVAVAAVVPAGGATLTYPGVAPCNTTLQACIDAALVGDVIEIATNTPISESPNIVRSLTLQPAAGYSPVLASGNYIAASVGGTDSAIFTFENLRLEYGVILVSNGGSGTVTANIDSMTIEQAFSTNPAFRLWNNSTGTMILNVTDCTAHIPAPFSGSTYGISLSQSGAGAITASILRNTFTVEGTNQGAVIQVATGAGTATADVIGNTITGTNFNSGISFYEYGNGTLSGRIINNLVVGEVSSSGAPAAISINGSGSGAVVSFEVINNTLAESDRGILISGRSDLGATMSGIFANNIVSSCDYSISVDSDFSGSISNRNNLIFDDINSSFTPGPGTLYLAPGFVGGGDYHLLPSSFAVNSGYNAAIPGDIATDLGGAPRIYEGTIDRGAFELQEAQQQQVFGIPTLAWPGLGLLALLLAITGVLAVRRSHHAEPAAG